MDAISYSHSVKQEKRIKNFISDPDSSSGLLTQPKVIAAGESVTVPTGRVAVLPNVQVNGEIVVEGDGEIFIPAGATLSKVVELEGNQDIDGIKNFLTSPTVPTPTTGTQAVNKDYADLKVALSQFTGANQSLSPSGYQKLPGGLILQWGRGTVSSTTTNQTLNIVYPISFPVNTLSNVLTHSGNADGSAGNNRGFIMSCEFGNANGFLSSYSSNAAVNFNYTWIAIGY